MTEKVMDLGKKWFQVIGFEKVKNNPIILLAWVVGILAAVSLVVLLVSKLWPIACGAVVLITGIFSGYRIYFQKQQEKDLLNNFHLKGQLAEERSPEGVITNKEAYRYFFQKQVQDGDWDEKNQGHLEHFLEEKRDTMKFITWVYIVQAVAYLSFIFTAKYHALGIPFFGLMAVAALVYDAVTSYRNSIHWNDFLKKSRLLSTTYQPITNALYVFFTLLIILINLGLGG